ncbi:MAG: polysaccharide deacetylase family protein [Planctomycetes bacterium]|nr:polysaccharide deacetylase family protein [Planctomycetota bacterium]
MPPKLWRVGRSNLDQNLTVDRSLAPSGYKQDTWDTVQLAAENMDYLFDSWFADGDWASAGSTKSNTTDETLIRHGAGSGILTPGAGISSSYLKWTLPAVLDLSSNNVWVDVSWKLEAVGAGVPESAINNFWLILYEGANMRYENFGVKYAGWHRVQALLTAPIASGNNVENSWGVVMEAVGAGGNIDPAAIDTIGMAITYNDTRSAEVRLVMDRFRIFQPKAAGVPKIMFTFDDGDSTNMVAARILEKHGFRGTFCLIPEYLGEASITIGGAARTPLTVAQTKDLLRRGHQIATHGYTSLVSGFTTTASRIREMVRAKRMLQDLGLGNPGLDLYAYPLGHVGEPADQLEYLQHFSGLIQTAMTHLSSDWSLNAHTTGLDCYTSIMPQGRGDRRTVQRTSMDLPENYTVDPLDVTSTAVNYVDRAILSRGDLCFMWHIIDAPGQTTAAELETLMAAIRVLVDAGTVEVVMVSDYVAGN